MSLLTFAHSTILVKYARSSLDLVLNILPPISGSTMSPVSRSSHEVAGVSQSDAAGLGQLATVAEPVEE